MIAVADRARRMPCAQIGSHDKDFRYMATSDLLVELNSGSVALDAPTERRILEQLLARLEDTSGDVSALAVKCLAPLSRNADDAVVALMAKSLCEGLVSGKEQRSDACAIALKTVLTEMPADQHSVVPKTLLAPLCGAASSDGMAANALIECLDVLHLLLEKFGTVLAAELEDTRATITPLLDAGRAPMRKRAATCLAALSAHVPDQTLASIVGDAMGGLASAGSTMAVNIRVTLIGAIARTVGARFGPHIAQVLPALAARVRSAGESPEDDELREAALGAIEAMMKRCHAQAAPLAADALDVSLELLSYDPNYADDEDSDGDDEIMDGDDDDYEDDEGDYSDDEDTSWKVRRASARSAATVFAAQPQTVSAEGGFHAASARLIGRFRDREEVVRLDVFAAYGALLGCAKKQGDALAAEVPALVKALARQLREAKAKEGKARMAAFGLLAQTCGVLPGCFAEQVGSLLDAAAAALAEDAAGAGAMKVEALNFIEVLLDTHAAGDVQPHLGVLIAPLCEAANDKYYKVAAAGLACIAQALKAVREPGGAVPADLVTSITSVSDVVAARMAATDQDLEVKERAITAASMLVSELGDLPNARASDMLESLLDKVDNEVTRLAAVRALTRVSSSPLAIDLSAISARAAAAFSPLVRQADHTMRAAALQALISLAGAKAGAPDAESLAGAIKESAALIVSDDLNLAAAALRLCVTSLHAAPAVSATVVDKALKPALQLARSPLLQGGALRSLQAFFAALASVNAPQASFDELHSELMKAARDAVAAAASSGGAAAASAAGGAARCAAGLCVAAGSAQCAASVNALMGGLSDGTNEAEVLLSLLCLGQMGRKMDMSAHAGAAEAVAAELTSASASESVKSAASFALGGIAAGNPTAYLPFIFQRVGSDAKLNYLLLQALREVIVCQAGVQGPTPTSAAAATGEVDEATPALSEGDVQAAIDLLLSMSESEEEGVRNVVAECLGKLALLSPAVAVPVIAANAASDKVALRYAAASAARYVFVDRPTQADEALAAAAPTLLGLLGDDDRHVRRAAALALSSAAHNKPALVHGLLPSLLPVLYAQTAIREDMVRMVDLGPFKHKIDDGLELRKASFECLDTLLASPSLAPLLEPAPLLQALVSALDDAYEIKVFAHITLERLTSTRPADVAAALPALCAPLAKTFAARLKSDAVKQEVDRHEDMLRGAARCIAKAELIKDLSCAEFTEMLAKLEKDAKIAPRIKAARAEVGADAHGGGDADAMDVD